MYRKCIWKCLWLQATTMHVMRYRGPTWEPWGPRSRCSCTVVAPICHLATNVAESVMFRWAFLPPLKWDGKLGLDHFSAFHHAAHASAVNLYWRIGGDFYFSWEIIGDTHTHRDTAGVCVCVCRQAAVQLEFEYCSDSWLARLPTGMWSRNGTITKKPSFYFIGEQWSHRI